MFFDPKSVRIVKIRVSPTLIFPSSVKGASLRNSPVPAREALETRLPPAPPATPAPAPASPRRP